MAFDLNTIATQNAHCSVDFMGQSASILYNPSTLTAGNIKKAMSGDAGFVEFFIECVKDWDVKRGTKKVPITKAGLEGVPMLFLRAIFRALSSDDAKTVSAEGKGSSAT